MNTKSYQVTLKTLTAQDFRLLGKNDLSYVRPLYRDGLLQYGLYDADGTEISIFPDERTAKTVAFQNDIVTLPLH